jgi:hypothetical protein
MQPYVGRARLDTTAMLRLIGADDLDLDDRYADLFANRPPYVSVAGPRIHAIGDNGLASAQVVGSHGVRNRVTLAFHDHPGLPERVFD